VLDVAVRVVGCGREGSCSLTELRLRKFLIHKTRATFLTRHTPQKKATRPPLSDVRNDSLEGHAN
jgi:hypothetical protein